MIDIRSPCPDLFLNNPHLTRLDESDPEVEIHDITYDDINKSGWNGLHFADAFHNDIEAKLNNSPQASKYGNVKIEKTGILPEIYISDDENKKLLTC